MNCIGYFRGSQGDRRALIAEYAARSGIKLIEVLSDGKDEYSAFRELQTLVKLGECDAVLLPNYRSLGEDRYVCLENELFFKRNGVRTIYIKRHVPDQRHELMIAVKRFAGFDPMWSAGYGRSIPETDDLDCFRRKPPFGYRIVDGEALVDEADARIVNYIFDEYASGKRIAEICDGINTRLAGEDCRFGNMTVKTVLRNEHYLGRKSKKGYVLPPIIRLEQWFSAHERLEREYGTERRAFPFFDRIFSDKSVSYLVGRAYSPEYFRREDYNVCVEGLEEAFCRLIMSFATKENARLLYEGFALPEAGLAKAALPEAARAHNRVLARFKRRLRAVKEGDFSDEAQRELERLTDLKNVGAMRLRRISSELELCSAEADAIDRFFSRAARMRELSFEEKAFIADAFICAVRIREGIVEALVRDPSDGSAKKLTLEGVPIDGIKTAKQQ